VQITNTLGLPLPIVQAIRNDGYTGTYKGRRANISVSALGKPVRQRRLEILHADELVEDASDRIWALLGQAIHTILERANVDGIVEERMYLDVEGWTVSGQFDHFTLADGVLSDYKVTSVWAIKDGGRDEWVSQLNVYAHMLRAHGYVVQQVRVVAIGRDWRKNEALRYGSSGYPQHQVTVIPLLLWPAETCEAYLRIRVLAHQATDTDTGILPLCTPEERWQRPATWAVVKDGNKKATKLCASEAEAVTVIGDAPKMHIEFRPGLAVRCSQYCAVKTQCMALSQRTGDGQWQAGELEPSESEAG